MRQEHWFNYLIEASLLGAFMVSACVFVALLEHPGSAARRALRHAGVRRGLVGLAMGATAVALITSPWGQRSGAHMNPAVTLAFLALGKVTPIDAAGYVVGQFAGGIAGVGLARTVLGRVVAHPSVGFVATRPGRRGPWVAWVAEFAIAFVLMSVVLRLSNDAGLAFLTPWAAGGLVAVYITLEAPLSGMSMNPARTLGSAVHARDFAAWWVYATAPAVAMLAAAWVFVATDGHAYCAKLDHRGDSACPFLCEIGGLRPHPGRAAGIQGSGE
ncbi:MAG: aquaporin [Phycisphaerae bacterium]|nr:aquaporin [Phycisphaerae bacterium]